jgi:hypothetical protein
MPLGRGLVAINEAPDVQVFVGVVVEVVLVRLKERRRKADRIARAGVAVSGPLRTVVPMAANAEEIEFERSRQPIHLQHVDDAFRVMVLEEIIACVLPPQHLHGDPERVFEQALERLLLEDPA